LRLLFNRFFIGLITCTIFSLSIWNADAANLSETTVFYLPEFIKINPWNGQVIGESGTDFQAYAREVFPNKGEKQPISLQGLRGETICFQLVIPKDLFDNIRYFEIISNVPELLTNIDIYLEVPIKATDKNSGEFQYIPDALLPIPVNKNISSVLSLIKDSYLQTHPVNYQIIWVDLYVTDDFPSGMHSFEIKTTLADNNILNFPFHAEIGSYTLPDSPVKISLNEYGPRYLRGLPKNLSEPQKWKIERRYFRMARAHHANLNPLPYKSQRGYPLSGFAPQIEVNDSALVSIDWTEFDRRIGPYLDGTAFPDGKPLDHLYLPFNPEWPAPFRLYWEYRKNYEKIWRQVAQAYVEHFRTKGWTGTVFQVYCNQKPKPNNQIPWNLDEPKGVEDYTALRYYTDLTHRVFVNAAPLKIKFRMDISHFYCDKHRWDQRKDFRVNGGDEILKPVDIWEISDHSLQSEVARQKARELIAAGKEVWWYGATPTLPESGLEALRKIYRVAQNHFTGFLVWKTVLTHFRESIGKDYIVYQGELFGLDVPVTSLRLKLLRRAVDDLRYLQLLQSQSARQNVDEVLEHWLNCSPADFRQFRQEVFRSLQEKSK